MSEEQQVAAEEAAVEAGAEFNIETALLFYKNLLPDISSTIDRMVSPFHYDKVGKATKRKKESTRTIDLAHFAMTIRAALVDLEVDSKKFENAKAQDLYNKVSMLIKCKEYIKSDLRSKLVNNEVDGVSEEVKQKALKELL